MNNNKASVKVLFTNFWLETSKIDTFGFVCVPVPYCRTRIRTVVKFYNFPSRIASGAVSGMATCVS